MRDRAADLHDRAGTPRRVWGPARDSAEGVKDHALGATRFRDGLRGDDPPADDVRRDDTGLTAPPPHQWLFVAVPVIPGTDFPCRPLRGAAQPGPDRGPGLCVCSGRWYFYEDLISLLIQPLR